MVARPVTAVSRAGIEDWTNGAVSGSVGTVLVMRPRVIVLLLALPAALLALREDAPERPPVAEHVPEKRVIERRLHAYRDAHQGGRHVADVEVTLTLDERGRGEVTVRPSAVGVGIEPLPGIEGRAGGNLRTAEELERLALEERIELFSRSLDDGRERDGTVAVAARGTLPARRLRPDGTIDHFAESLESVLALELASGSLEPGAWRVTILVDGAPRLEVDVEFTREDGRVLEIRDPVHLH